MTYADLITALSTLLEIQPTDADFLAIMPRCIEYAELRMYRELDLAVNSTRLSGAALGGSATLTSGNRNLVLPASTFVVLTDVNIITPVSAASPDAGARTRLTRVNWDFLDAVYGAPGALAMPVYFALQDAATIAVGPWPDQAYPVELFGSIRPAPLASGNQSTVLSMYFPDLLVAACMVFMSGYTKNFGAQASDPQMSLSWEAIYKNLMESAATEEARKKAQSVMGSA